jgi:anti-anti-sigma factor
MSECHKGGAFLSSVFCAFVPGATHAPLQFRTAVTVERDAVGVSRLNVEGGMTFDTVGELKDVMLAPLAWGDSLKMNLAGVTAIDSAGLELLVLLRSEAHMYGRNVSITDHSRAVMDILDLSAMEDLFGDTILIHLDQLPHES